MAKPRFVLRYRGEGAAPAGDLARLEESPDVVVVEASSRMLLVECDPDTVQGLQDALPDWLVAPEQTYAVPDTRKKIEGPPE